MKLTTALYTAAFVLAPAVGFAADQSARQQDSTTASERSYPDWPAIAKTAPQKNTDQQKPAEQTEPQKNTDQHPVEQIGSSGNEPSLLEKAGRALEAVTGACGQLRQACLDEDELGQGQSKCQDFRTTCGSNWLPRP
jgi:hypothetical protein